jgi:hypothetical protein
MSKNPDWDKADYRKRRALAIEYLGEKCVDCGTEDGLQFDHREATKKSFEIAKNLNRCWDVLVVELDKCSLRCHPCHLSKTKKNKETGGGWNRQDILVHGTNLGYIKFRCRCDECRSAAATAKGRKPPTKKYSPRKPT